MYVRLHAAENARGIVRQQFLCHWLMAVPGNKCALTGLPGFRNGPENWEGAEQLEEEMIVRTLAPDDSERQDSQCRDPQGGKIPVFPAL